MMRNAANESSDANKLMHLKTKHCSLDDSSADFFFKKAETVKNTRLDSCGPYQQKYKN
jgi:hypothetical protein